MYDSHIFNTNAAKELYIYIYAFTYTRKMKLLYPNIQRAKLKTCGGIFQLLAERLIPSTTQLQEPDFFLKD